MSSGVEPSSDRQGRETTCTRWCRPRVTAPSSTPLQQRNHDMNRCPAPEREVSSRRALPGDQHQTAARVTMALTVRFASIYAAVAQARAEPDRARRAPSTARVRRAPRRRLSGNSSPIAGAQSAIVAGPRFAPVAERCAEQPLPRLLEVPGRRWRPRPRLLSCEAAHEHLPNSPTEIRPLRLSCGRPPTGSQARQTAGSALRCKNIFLDRLLERVAKSRCAWVNGFSRGAAGNLRRRTRG